MHAQSSDVPLPDWIEQRLLPLRDVDVASSARQVHHVVARTAVPRMLPVQQAADRRAARRRVAAAGRAALWPSYAATAPQVTRALMGDWVPGEAFWSAAHRPPRRCEHDASAALSVLPRLAARGRAGVARCGRRLPGGVEMGRHPRAADPTRKARRSIWSRGEELLDGRFPGDRRRSGGACPTAPCSTASCSHWDADRRRCRSPLLQTAHRPQEARAEDARRRAGALPRLRPARSGRRGLCARVALRERRDAGSNR